MGGCNQDIPAEELILERLTLNGQPCTRQYRKGRLLGKGGFARVYELTDLGSGEVFAGKIVQKSTLTKARAKQKLMSEIKIHRTLDHPNIVRFERYFEDDVAVYLLLELCENQTLMELLKTKRRLKQAEVCYYLRQIIEGCMYMREKKVLHRDLKLGNLFINKDGVLKIGDFGLAAQLEKDTDRKTTICGTPNYIAPEVLSSKQGMQGHSYEADVWSIGVVVYTLLVGRPPFETSDVKATYRKIQSCDFEFPVDRVFVSEEAQSMVRHTLLVDPSKRPSLHQIKHHPIFHSRDCTPPRPARAKRPLPDPEPCERPKRSSPNEPGESSRWASRPEEASEAAGGLPHRLEALQLHTEENKGFPEGRAPAGECGAALLELLGGPWVVKWVDYSHKYGMGYLLADNTAGACFNDSTKLVMDSGREHVEYLGRRRERPEDKKPQRFALAGHPEELQKKVTLIKHFASYLGEHPAEGEHLQPVEGAGSGPALVFVKKWVRTRHAVVFRLSNRMYQVNFFDSSMVVLSVSGGRVAYFNKEGLCETVTLHQMEGSASEALKKRFAYAKDVIVQLASTGAPQKPEGKPGVEESRALPAQPVMPSKEPSALLLAA